MTKRFQRIRREFGTVIFLRISLLLVGLIAMTVFGYFGFSSFLAGIIALVGLILGFLLRKLIADKFDYSSRVVAVGLFIYGVVLFLGDRLGVENNVKLAIVTATTVIVFDLQFWSLSDERRMNLGRRAQE